MGRAIRAEVRGPPRSTGVSFTCFLSPASPALFTLSERFFFRIPLTRSSSHPQTVHNWPNLVPQMCGGSREDAMS